MKILRYRYLRFQLDPTTCVTKITDRDWLKLTNRYDSPMFNDRAPAHPYGLPGGFAFAAGLYSNSHSL